MVTGRVPFEGDVPFTIGVKHKSEQPRDPRELNAQTPADRGRLILRCLAKEKEQRYQNTGEILAGLDQIEKGLPTTERVKPERRALTSREITVKFSLKRLFIPAAFILLLVVAAIVICQLKPRQKPGPPPLSAKPSLAVMYFENRTNEQDLYYQKGLEHLWRWRFEEAAQNFEKAVELDPTDGNSYGMLAYTLSNMKDHPGALSAVRKCIAVLSDSMNSHDSAWEINVLAGLHDEGLTFLEEAKKRLPDFCYWHADAGETYLLKG
jgi:tetratricopeptide (TPR) repeat protein